MAGAAAARGQVPAQGADRAGAGGRAVQAGRRAGQTDAAAHVHAELAGLAGGCRVAGGAALGAGLAAVPVQEGPRRAGQAVDVVGQADRAEGVAS